jgi:hypothetical protein
MTLARVIRRERQKLGTLYHHLSLYWRLLEKTVEQLPKLGRERYRRSGVDLLKV